MEVLREIRLLESEGRSAVEKAEREREKRLQAAKEKAASLKKQIIGKAEAEAEAAVEEGRKEGAEEARKILAKNAKEKEKIAENAVKKSASAKKIVFQGLLDV
jgi:vacuolar-type H+-ATPase subunit H